MQNNFASNLVLMVGFFPPDNQLAIYTLWLKKLVVLQRTKLFGFFFGDNVFIKNVTEFSIFPVVSLQVVNSVTETCLSVSLSDITWFISGLV